MHTINTALVPVPQAGELIVWQAELDITRAFIRASRAASTRAAYAKDWKAFLNWCAARGADIDLRDGPCGAALVAQHLAWMAAQGRAVASIGRRAAAIAYAHKLRELVPPTASREVRDCMAGIRRTLGVRPRHRKAAATADLMHAMLAVIPKHTLAGKRDRALLALGFGAALRRSELVGLNVEDFSEAAEGVRVMIRRSKTDQTAQGHEIPIPHGRHIRPYQAVQAWLQAAGITEGAIFRAIRRGGHVQDGRLSDHAVACIIKQWAAKAGLDAGAYAGHSLRAGFATEATEGGADPFAICTVTRHKNINTLMTYVRRRDEFKKHPGDSFL